VIREVVVRTFDAPHEAELAAGYLRANGVQVRIDNDVLQGMNPLLTPVFGRVRLHVLAHRLKEAEELLAEADAAVEPEPQAQQELEGDRLAVRAAASAVLGFTLLPILGQLYSLWLLFGLRGKPLGPRGRKNRALALVLNVALLGLVGYALLVS
jgi:hypothetical protein